MPVIFSQRALSDLENIRVHIAEDNPYAVSRMAVRLLAACDRLEQFPERGRRGASPGTRELTTVRPYVVVYEIRKPHQIEVLAIWHGAQDRSR